MRDYFPFPTIRKGQDTFYTDTRDALRNQGILFAHSPTGIGKTAAVLAAAVEVAIEQDKRVFFMTPRQSQHRIAIETLRQINERHSLGLTVADIISKQAMCPSDIAGEFHAVFGMLCAMQIKSNSCPFWRTDENLIDQLSQTILHVEEVKEISEQAGVCPHRAVLEVAMKARVLVCDYN